MTRYRLIAAVLGSAAALVTCSAHMARLLADHGLTARKLCLPVLPPGAAFARRRAPTPLFVAAGRLSREKGIEVLVRALAHLRQGGIDAGVRLIGDGPERSTIEALAVSLGVADAVEITGWVEHEAVEAHMADAWALVAPSLWAEPLGLSAVESIVRNVPVVASSVGGYAETVEHGVTGLLCANGDVDGLAGCLAEIAHGRAFSDPLLPQGAVVRLAQRHDLGAHLDGLGAIFEKVLR